MAELELKMEKLQSKVKDMQVRSPNNVPLSSEKSRKSQNNVYYPPNNLNNPNNPNNKKSNGSYQTPPPVSFSQYERDMQDIDSKKVLVQKKIVPRASSPAAVRPTAERDNKDALEMKIKEINKLDLEVKGVKKSIQAMKGKKVIGRNVSNVKAKISTPTPTSSPAAASPADGKGDSAFAIIKRGRLSLQEKRIIAREDAARAKESFSSPTPSAYGPTGGPSAGPSAPHSAPASSGPYSNGVGVAAQEKGSREGSKDMEGRERDSREKEEREGRDDRERERRVVREQQRMEFQNLKIALRAGKGSKDFNVRNARHLLIILLSCTLYIYVCSIVYSIVYSLTDPLSVTLCIHCILPLCIIFRCIFRYFF